MNLVEEYIERLEGNQRELISYIHQFFSTFPELVPHIKFKIPFYYGKSWICYLNPIKKDGVELVFVRARELEDTMHLLDFKKRKMAAGLTFFKIADIQEELIAKILAEAIQLDDSTPYTFKKNR